MATSDAPGAARVSFADTELLRTLEAAFARHAGADRVIAAAELQEALGLRSEYLAKRVLLCLDDDHDGVVGHDEFLSGVRKLVAGSPREKLAFAFRLHDDDGDGQIGQLDLLRMIAISLAENAVVGRMSQPPERLAQVLMQQADKNRDGKISFDEFEAILAQHPGLLQRMTRSEALWIAPNEDLLARLEGPRRKPLRLRLRRALDNRRAELVVVAFVVLLNLTLFLYAMHLEREDSQLDLTMQLGRALGTCIAVDLSLILIPVMRRLLTRLRSTPLGRFLPIESAVSMHQWLGQALFALALGHSAILVTSFWRGHPRTSLAHLFFATRIGGTGLGLVLVFACLWVFSQAPIRRTQRFELFYYSHLSYVLLFVLCLIHAPGAALFIALPVALFCAEQVVRLQRRARASVISELQPLRSSVTRLVIERPSGFAERAGDYVFLRVPAIARYEWHPFTLSSAPESEQLAIHVRALGNWTNALRALAEAALPTQSPMLVHIDGPYGSPTAHIFESRYAVFIGAGIGVTPFASVLESLLRRKNANNAEPGLLQKAHFFWLARDQYSFEWFAALLSDLERSDTQQSLDVHVCLTGGRSGSTAIGLEIARALQHAAGQRDLVTGLRSLTHMGRPDWKLVLSAIKEQHAGERVDVYFCGPDGLARELRALCVELKMPFRQERF